MATENPEDKIPTSADPTVSAVKKDGRKKDPSEPRVVPFQLISAANRARLAEIGPANDQTLTMLIDAYTRKDGEGTVSPEELEQVRQEALRLRSELKAAQESITAHVGKQQSLEQELSRFKSAVPAAEESHTAEKSRLEQQLAEANQQIEHMKADMLKMNKQTGMDSKDLQNLQAQIKELQDKLGAAMEKSNEDDKSIASYISMKAASDKKITELEKRYQELRDNYINLEEGREVVVGNTYPEGEILHYFPEITAKFIDATCKKLTACRRDGKEVTPQMVLGDMFNRYTIDRFNLWFYKWVLEDEDLIKIAKEVEPKINSKRMLRAALGINK